MRLPNIFIHTKYTIGAKSVYSTNVYLYVPRQVVVTLVGNSPRRYETVYAKNLKLHKGVDNKIQFKFINQEQKAVDITGKEITIRVINSDGSTVLIKKALTLILPLTGLAEFQLLASELENIDSQKAHYSIEIPLSGFDLPVFVDSDSGARGVISIEDSILPKHTPSMEVSIPTHPSPVSNTVTFTSSVINTSYNPVLTIQSYFDNFSGIVKIQGSTIPDNDWYDITESDPYLSHSDTDYYTIAGYHPFVRLQFQCTQGNVTDILVR